MYFTKTFLIIALIICGFQQKSAFAGEVTLDGHYSAGNDMHLNAKVLKGKGVLDAKNITIICDEFHFTGTIRCNGVCKIRVKNDFDHTMFQKEGTGTFTIILSSKNFESHTQTTLLGKVDKLLLENSSLTAEQIIQNLTWIRQQVGENDLNELAIRQAIEEKIKQQLSGGGVSLPKESPKVSHKKSDSALQYALACGGLTIITLLASIFIFTQYKDSKMTERAIGLGLLSFFSGVGSLCWLSQWKKNKNEEKSPEEKTTETVKIPRDKLLLMQSKLDEIFAQPYVPDATIIQL